LEDPSIIKTGIGIVGKYLRQGDKYHIQKCFNVNVQGVCDVADIAALNGVTNGDANFLVINIL
jgi:hypothetical protein